jgi:four helix bundle protein
MRVYQMALEFTDEIYQITKRFPSEERFGLTDQFRRAAVSVTLNIAEGSGGSKPEFKQFLKIARRSIRECIAVIEISFRQKYISAEARSQLRDVCADMSRMLAGLLKSLSPSAER